MTLVLRDDDVRDLVGMVDALDALEAATRAEAEGTAVHAERSNLLLPGGWMRMAPAALLHENVTGYKEFHLAAAGVRFTIRLFAWDTGEPLVEMDGRHITALRTGASGGLGVRLLAPEDPGPTAVIGSGDTALRQLEAAALVRRLGVVRVFSPTPENRERFAKEASRALDLHVVAVNSVVAAVEDAGLLLVATDTKGQGHALDGYHLHHGLHVNSIGSTLPNQRELDTSAWAAADRIVVDTPGVLRDSGDAIAARGAGVHDDDRVATLSDVMVGRAEGRTRADDITVYKSVGTSAQDVAVALVAYRRAVAAGRGTTVEDFVTVKPD